MKKHRNKVTRLRGVTKKHNYKVGGSIMTDNEITEILKGIKEIQKRYEVYNETLSIEELANILGITITEED